GDYTVTATNGAGTITSSAARLTVVSPPALAQPPRSQQALLGSAVTFTATVNGDGPFTYQWRKDGNAIVGATSATLVLATVGGADAGAYSVVVTGFGGSSASSPALLTVNLPGRLVNLSLLTELLDGADSFRMGFVLGGAGAAGTTPVLV